MTKEFEHCRQLERRLWMTRWMHGGQESPGEDATLDEMEDIWLHLSDEEQDLLLYAASLRDVGRLSRLHCLLTFQMVHFSEHPHLGSMRGSTRLQKPFWARRQHDSHRSQCCSRTVARLVR
jgi:hypothetical protein